MLTWIQIIALLFGLLMMYLIYSQYRKKLFNKGQLYVWEIIWLGFVIATLMPNKITVITSRLGIVRGFDLFAFIAFIIIFTLSFINYIAINKLKKQLEQKVREKALEKIHENPSRL